MRNNKIKKQITILAILLMTLVTGVYVNFSTDLSSSNSLSNSEDIIEDNIDDKIDDIFNPIETPELNIEGAAAWWNYSFVYRQLINITNPYEVDLENYGVSITFNYQDLVDENKMNSTCKDIRIVENGVLRKYYYELDQPSGDYVTVWFDTNVLHLTTETDVYMYYGNNSVDVAHSYFMDTASDSPSDAFGWIRNGDFELDYIYGPRINHLFGWNWSDLPPQDLDPGGSSIRTESRYQHGLDWPEGAIECQERVYDDYNFKWGSINNSLDDQEIITDEDFEGRLFSYPFIVPSITGPASERIYIQVFRNIRFYSNKPQQLQGYYLRINEGNQYYLTGGDVDPLKLKYFEDWQVVKSGGSLTTAYDHNDYVPTMTYANTRGSSPIQYTDGELTDYIYLDVTDYQGELIFLEVGMYGNENEHKKAFGEVDNIKFNFTLGVDLNPEIQLAKSDVRVITRDVDGRIVPNAEVMLVNASNIKYSGETSEDGSILFTDVAKISYNITVNYTLSSDLKAVVYDSSKIPKEYDVTGTTHTFKITLNMSTIDFQIVDWGNRPFDKGFINIRESNPGTSLENLTLNNEGKTTFRWLNKPSYYYEIYFNDTNYSPNPTKLNSSYVYRSDYTTAGEKFQEHTIKVNETNIQPEGSGFFSVNQTIYGNGSLDTINNKKILKANITLSNMFTSLNNISVYYINSSNQVNENHLIYQKIYYDAQSDFINIDLRFPQLTPQSLIDDVYQVYGLLIEVNGYNSSRCDGIIEVNLNETWNIWNKTAITKLNIKAIANDIPRGNVIIKVNSSDFDEFFSVNLYTYKIPGVDDPEKDGFAWLWYLSGYTYNFSLEYFEYTEFNVTQSDKWKPPGRVESYSYSLTDDNKTLEFDIYLGTGPPPVLETKLSDLTHELEVIWRDNITIFVNYTYTTDGWDSSHPITDPDWITCTITSTGAEPVVYLQELMDPTATDGIYAYRFNSSILSAGILGRNYWIIISAHKTGYDDPSDETGLVFVDAYPTGMTLHDYNNMPNIITVESQFFGELINLTIRYFDDDDVTLLDATVTYDWLNLGPQSVNPDPINPGYYTFTLDTSLAETVGRRSIVVTAYLENYTMIDDFIINLDIDERPTTINGEAGLLYIDEEVWVEDAEFFDFTYRDVLSENKIGDLNTYSYTWQELDEDGDPIEDESGTGILIANPDDTYTLDFDTEDLDVGIYYLYINLKKDNYELRAALINLEIKLRIMEVDMDATNLEGDQATVVKGEDIVIEIKLFDTTRDDDPLTDATVKLIIGEKKYAFVEEEDGVYKLTFKTDDIDAFFTSQTLTGEITIEKDNFEDESESITFVVTMEEIYPGVPTFYFILIMAAIIGTAGSLISYRVIQQARIPGFVKKVRKVKSAIKTKKSIPQSALTPPKEKVILKQFGREWESLGLSLKDVLGLEETKPKGLSEIKGSFEQGGDGV